MSGIGTRRALTTKSQSNGSLSSLSRMKSILGNLICKHSYIIPIFESNSIAIATPDGLMEFSFGKL